MKGFLKKIMKIFYHFVKHGEIDDDENCQEAANPQELIATMKMFGHQIKITRTEGTPTVSKAVEAFKKNINVGSLPPGFKLENPNGVFTPTNAPPATDVAPGNIATPVKEVIPSPIPTQVQHQIPPTSIQASPIVEVKQVVLTTAPIEFENNGVKFKIENNIVFKKDWIDVDMSVFRIDPSTIQIQDPEVREEILGRVKIQKLDWIQIENSAKDS